MPRSTIHRGFFNASRAVTFPQFIVGTIIGGVLLGIGWSVGSMIVKGIVKRYAPHDSILVAGDF